MSISQGEIKVRQRTCIERWEHYRKHGQSYRWKHLNSCLPMAKEKEDEEAEKQILAITQQDKDRAFWRRINYVLGKQSSGACSKVQVPQEDGGVIEHTSQEDLHNAIWSNIHRKRFYLVEEAHCAPVTCKGNLAIMQIPKLLGPFWQVVMSTLQILTRPQEKSLRSVPKFGSQSL